MRKGTLLLHIALRSHLILLTIYFPLSSLKLTI